MAVDGLEADITSLINESKHGITRKAFLFASLAGISFVFAPSKSLALSWMNNEDGPVKTHQAPGFLVREVRDGLVVIDVLTGERLQTTGDLKTSGSTMMMVLDNGSTLDVVRLDNTAYVNDNVVASIDFVSNVSTRTCVEIKRERFHMNTEALSWGQLVATMCSLGLTMPYSVIVGIVDGLISLSYFKKPEYFETISYYCDTPSPRMRYVTYYYTDSGYSNLVHSQTSETVFQNP